MTKLKFTDFFLAASNVACKPFSWKSPILRFATNFTPLT